MQPLAVVEELAEAEELVKRDPGFQEALAKRGVTDFEAVQVDAWPAGNFGDPRSRTGGWPAASPSSARAPATASGRTRSTG